MYFRHFGFTLAKRFGAPWPKEPSSAAHREKGFRTVQGCRPGRRADRPKMDAPGHAPECVASNTHRNVSLPIMFGGEATAGQAGTFLSAGRLPTLMPAEESKLDLDESCSESSSKSSSLYEHDALAGRAIAKPPIGPYPEAFKEDDDDDSLGDSEGSSKGGSAGVMKKAWRPEEDAQLMALVTEMGPAHWSIIASYLEGRVGKQCRER